MFKQESIPDARQTQFIINYPVMEADEVSITRGGDDALSICEAARESCGLEMYLAAHHQQPGQRVNWTLASGQALP